MGTIFSTDDIRGHVNETLTTEYVWNVGKALADWLPDNGDIVVSRSNTANDATVHALIEGVLLQGRNAVEAGEQDPQAVVATISEKRLAGGVFITHDELDDLEIITLFDATGATITDQTGLAQIGELVEAGNFVPASNKGQLINSK